MGIITDGKAAGGALVLAVLSGVAAAQQVAHPALTDRWSFQVGLHAPQVDTTASLNGSGGRVGTAISFEDDLNLTDRKTMPAVLASVRLGERWKFEAEYLSLKRSGIRTILWATGFRPDHSWLEVPVFDRKGRLRHDGGVVPSPGMYVVGLQFLRRRKSALIDGAGDDARELSAHLATYLHGRIADAAA